MSRPGLFETSSRLVRHCFQIFRGAPARPCSDSFLRFQARRARETPVYSRNGRRIGQKRLSLVHRVSFWRGVQTPFQKDSLCTGTIFSVLREPCSSSGSGSQTGDELDLSLENARTCDCVPSFLSWPTIRQAAS